MDTVTLLEAARTFNILSDNKIRSGMLYGNFYDSPRTGISYWRTTRPEIEKSLEEVDIPYMKRDADSSAEDPVGGVEQFQSQENTGGQNSVQRPAAAAKTKETEKRAQTADDAKTGNTGAGDKTDSGKSRSDGKQTTGPATKKTCRLCGYRIKWAIRLNL